jgi:hypothetical protein
MPNPDLAAALATIAAALDAPPAPTVDLAPVLDDLAALRARVEELEDAAPALLVVDPSGAPLGETLPGARHPQVDTLLTAVSARDARGARLNVWIAGPAGSGKTFAAEQVAGALGLAFGFHGAMTYAHELLGFVDAGGRYHSTQFVALFENGGVCLLDELDSGTSEALLALNAALANGQMSLPDGRIIKRHADFVCIGAANTFGAGATAEYVGRNKLDGAFLSRFPVKLAWDYDPDLERAICGNPEWAEEVQTARARAASAGLKVLIDPRHSMAGAALLAAGMDRATVARLTYLAGLTDAQVSLIGGAA